MAISPHIREAHCETFYASTPRRGLPKAKGLGMQSKLGCVDVLLTKSACALISVSRVFVIC